MKVVVNHVNAFTAESEGGNPAGIVFDADDCNDEQLQDIAKKVGFSETAFISKSSEATRRLRFFTPTEEVDLCGHATIASWSLMRQRDLINNGTFTQLTSAGILKVDIGTDGLVYMEQANAEFFEHIDTLGIQSILGITDSDFHATLKPQIVSTGLKDVIVVLNNEAALMNMTPDFDAMAMFSKKHDVIGMHVACLREGHPTLATARNFAPLVGINEESATGTSNGALLCYLKRYNALPQQSEYVIEQGKSMGQTSHIYGKFENENVWIGGRATTVGQIEVTI